MLILTGLLTAVSLTLATAAPGDAKGEKGAKGDKKGAPATPEEAFKRLDKNGDGKVTIEEISASKRFEGKAEEAKTHLAGMDDNKDGSVSLDEFKAHPPKKGPKGGDGKKPEGDKKPDAKPADPKPAETK